MPRKNQQKEKTFPDIPDKAETNLLPHTLTHTPEKKMGVRKYNGFAPFLPSAEQITFGYVKEGSTKSDDPFPPLGAVM